ncbi:hypothetical protein [Nocardia sp. NPDC052566]|uniref:hypothetical protein n=1 Tax=Nocardia sp. NPDC052566 TaxID=3364330 RepID=UPI0037C63520
MSSINQAGQFPVADPAAPFADMAALRSAPVSFGYYQEDVARRQAAVEHNRAVRKGPIGWWNRHPALCTGVSFVVACNLGLLPLVQSAVLTVLRNAF